MRNSFKYAVPAVAIYVALLAGLFTAMLQPPAEFGRTMSKLPTISYVLFPFRPMWLIARKGSLKVGDAASNFTLQTADRSKRVRLSSFRSQEPVALIFGSHT